MNELELRYEDTIRLRKEKSGSLVVEGDFIYRTDHIPFYKKGEIVNAQPLWEETLCNYAEVRRDGKGNFDGFDGFSIGPNSYSVKKIGGIKSLLDDYSNLRIREDLAHLILSQEQSEGAPVHEFSEEDEEGRITDYKTPTPCLITKVQLFLINPDEKKEIEKRNIKKTKAYQEIDKIYKQLEATKQILEAI